MRYLKTIPIILLLVFTTEAYASNPPVKKSRSNICHPAGGTYYDKTKKYTSYNSMEACLKSGGREPRR